MIKKAFFPKKRILALFAGIILTTLVLISSLPSLISSNWGKNQLLSIANSYIPGSIEAKKIQLSWFGPQEAEGIELKDPTGHSVASLSHFSTDASLFDLFLQKINRGFVQIDGLSANIVEEQPGITNLQHALIYNISASGEKNLNPLKIGVANVNAKLNITSASEPVTIHVKGQTKQGELTGSFDIDVALKSTHSDKWHQIDQNGEATLSTNIKNFPVALIDNLIALKKPELSGIATAALGKTLNLVAHNTIAQSKLLFSMEANSPTLSTKLEGQIHSGKLQFNNLGAVSFVITPELVHYLALLNVTTKDIQLLKPAKAQMLIQELSLPISVPARDLLSQISLKADLNIEEAELNGTILQSPLQLREIQTSIQIPQNEKTIFSKLQGDFLQSGRTMHVNLSATIEKPLQEVNWMEHLSSHSEIKIDLNNVPLALADRILNLKNTLVSTLGQQANIFAQTKLSGKQAAISLSVNSDHLTIPLMQFRLDNTLTLEQPVTIQYHLDPSVLALLDIKTSGILLQNNSLAQLRLENFSMPLTSIKDFAANPIDSLKDASIHSVISLSSISFSDQKWGTVVAKDIRADLQGDNLKDLQYQFSMNLETNGQDLLSANIGDSAHLLVNGKKDQMKIDWSSSLTKASLKGSLKEGLFSITEPAAFTYVLTPNSAQLFGLTANGALQLDQPATIQLVINPSKKPINLFQLSDLQSTNLNLNGRITVNELLISRDNADSTKAIIRNLNLPWELDSSNDRIKMDITASTQLGSDRNGTLQGNANITNWNNDFSKAIVQGELLLKNLPVVFLEALTKNDDLVEILGPTIDVDLIGSTSQSHAVDISFKGDRIQAEAAVILGDAIELQDPNHPATIAFTITPERFRTIRRSLFKNEKNPNHDPFTLASHADFKATISSLHIPLNSENQKGWTRTALKARVEISDFEVIDAQQKQNFNLEKIVANIDTQNLAKQIQFHVFADQDVQSKEDNETTIDGTMENAFTSNGEINRNDLSLQLTAKSRNLPAGLLSHLVYKDPSIRNKVEALFGPTMDTDVKISLQRMSGPLQANFQGKNGHMKIDSMVSQGVLTLQRPLEIQVAVTPQLGRSILQDFIPILSGAIAAERPIRITVDPQGFSFPIREFNIAKIQIGRATIDLGKMQFTNEGDLGNVFALLKPTTQENLSVWFTPLYLDMDNGALRLNRMDMLLLSRYPIALWGKINFPKDRVDLNIGLTGTALSQALNLKNLESNYMMQLPFSGRIGEASIDKAKATTRISALVAQTQGGPQGVILGTVLDIAGGSLAERTPPEPTTKPLPWETTTSNTADSGEHQKQKEHHKKSDSKDPVKMIEKGASSLIKSLFH
jgi:hypothetical protein